MQVACEQLRRQVVERHRPGILLPGVLCLRIHCTRCLMPGLLCLRGDFWFLRVRSCRTSLSTALRSTVGHAPVSETASNFVRCVSPTQHRSRNNYKNYNTYPRMARWEPNVVIGNAIFAPPFLPLTAMSSRCERFPRTLSRLGLAPRSHLHSMLHPRLTL